MAKVHALGAGLLLVLFLWSVECVNGFNECERGVRRHHPSQANVYQEFTRKNYRKQWMDKSCDDYMIFDPRTCACVEVWDAPEDKNPPPKSKKVERKRQQRRRGEYDGDDRREGERDRQPKSISKYNKVRGRRGEKKQTSHEVMDRQEERKSKQNTKTRKEYWIADQSSEEEEIEPDCYLHRPSSESPSHFERWTDGKWEEEDCNWPFYTGLVWSQESCRCEWGPNRTIAKPQMENSIPAACLMMLKITFDNGRIKDDGRGIWLKVRNKDEAHVEDDTTAVGGFSGAFRGASIEVPYFKSNVLGSIFHIGLMFKLCPGEPDTSINIVHNHCEQSRKGTTLIVSYQAWRKQITVAMKTVKSGKLVEDYCVMGGAASKSKWIKLDVRYTDSYLEVSVNDEICLGSDKFFGELATNDCPLTLLGDSFCGNIDEVIVTRGCTEAHAIS